MSVLLSSWTALANVREALQGWCKVGKKLSLFAPALRKVENKLNKTMTRYFYLYSVILHKKKSKYA